jgi:hypothetical protein
VIRRLRTLVAGVVLVAPLVAAVPVSSAVAAPAAPSKVPSLLRQQAEKIGQTMRAQHGLAKAQADSLSAHTLSISSAGAIGVQVHALHPVGSAEESQLRSLGATIQTSSASFAPVAGADLPDAGLISAMVPYDKLDAVAALDWVATLRPSLRPVSDAGAITAEGVPLHKADIAQRQGLTGKGLKIGAISDDVDHLADSIARGELPPDVQVVKSADFDGDEGTAMLEIVHDMAPDAKLMFATTGETNADYVNAFHLLANAGANMITEDIALDDEPVFAQGIGATTAENLARHGVFISSSAGNLATRHGQRVPAAGTGRTPDDQASSFSACPAGALHNTVNLRGTDNSVNLNLRPGAAILPTLQWSEPRAIFPTEGQGGFTDLNLYLIDASGSCLAMSNAAQANGVGDTIEQFIYQNTTAVDQPVRLVVDVAGTSSARAVPTLDLKWRALSAGVQTLDPAERAGSLNPDSNYLGFATSAGAANSSVSVDPATVPLEAFSAAGPIQIMTTTRCPGGHAGPCRGVPGGGKTVTFPAPTWTAADGESVSGVGPFGSGTCPAAKQGDCRFFGTSAATPTAVGVAALWSQRFHGLLPPVLLNLVLSHTAVPRDPTGWGAGVLSAVIP